MKTILRNASDAEIFGRMMKTAQHGTFDGLATENGSLPPYLDECRWWTCLKRWSSESRTELAPVMPSRDRVRPKVNTAKATKPRSKF